ncbi:MAG: DUF433 domain-containing protein [Planctomycetaceae bacterium]|nr:DUF433 domain-containing protein [Planctomycetaceae bacterium]
MVTIAGNIPELLGKGLYTPSEAARLTRLGPSTVRRWIAGYSFRYATSMGPKRGYSGSLIHSDIPRIDRHMALSFLELIETYIAGAFLRTGVSLHTVRLAHRHAVEKLQMPHPFAMEQFKTDGKGIFLELEGEAPGSKALLELSRVQYAFPEILAEYLELIDFDRETELACQWWPLGKKLPVVINPAIAFGSPVIAGTRVTVQAILDALDADETEESVAKWFSITRREVDTAILLKKQRLAG